MAKGKYHEWITKDGLTVLRGWAREGLTDEQISKNIGIAPGTLYDWKNRFPEIDEALKKGKRVVDNEVEEALIKSALGHYYTEQETYAEGKPNGEKVKRIKNIRKYAQPNATSLIFWLKNRRPDLWRDAHKIDMENDIRVNPQEQVDKYRKYLQEGESDEKE